MFIIVPVWRKKRRARCGVTCLQHERKGEGRTGKSRLARVRLALADPLRCERVAKAVERDQLVVGAHEAVGLRERLERPADIACRREGRARLRQDVAVPDLDRPGKAAQAQLSAVDLVGLLQEGE